MTTADQTNKAPNKLQQAAWHLAGVMAYQVLARKGVPIKPIQLLMKLFASEYVVGSHGKGWRSKLTNVRRPISSLSKLMTATIVLDQIKSGQLDSNQKIAISERAGSSNKVQLDKKLNTGDKYTIRDLIKAMLLASSNSAAITLAEHVAGTEENFVTLMNDQAIEMGLKKTSFANSTGLSPKHYQEDNISLQTNGENFSTARDVNQLFRELLTTHPDVEQMYSEEAKLTKYLDDDQTNTEPFLRFDRPNWKVGSGWSNPAVGPYKSGMTNPSGFGYAASAQHDNLLDGTRAFMVGLGLPTLNDRLARPSELIKKLSGGKITAKFQNKPSKWRSSLIHPIKQATSLFQRGKRDVN